MLILNVIKGPDKGRKFELPDNEPQQIGRSSESLPLTDPTISRRHCELTPDEGRWRINDLKSANGTYVNGTRITKQTLLMSGDQIRTGSTLFVFGRVTEMYEESVEMVSGDRFDTSLKATFPSNDESVIMASPEPSAAAESHLKIMYDMMQLVGTIFDKQLLLDRVMDLIMEHFDPDRGFILAQDEDLDRLNTLAVRYKKKPKSKDEEKISVSKTIVQDVLDKSEGVLSSNAMADSRFSAGDSIQAYGIRSAICVPMKFRDHVFGVIYIDSLVANYTFTEDQLRLMTAIGAQTGLALENAELYQRGLEGARLAAVGETVTSLSHSIKNILQAIRGGAEVVELGLRKNDLNVVANGWDILRRNLDRIYDLTMNMLTFSKRRKPEIELLRLGHLLEEVIELMQHPCDHRNVGLIADIDPDMPPVPADSSGLHQAVMNLMSNALDAVDPGSGVITLRARYDEESQMAFITVSDNGSGIDEGTQKQLFTPFYSTKGLRGTGLGLVVTKKIIEEHRGYITVDSKPNQGTTITLALPTELEEDPAATIV
ncbi:MAG: ATP-binding protein [Planctomycetota bacterium]